MVPAATGPLFRGPLKCGEGPGYLPRAFFIEDLIMNLPTKLGIIGLGVMVMMLLGVAVLMLWRS